MVDAADIVMYERVTARVAISLGALAALLASFLLARVPLKAAAQRAKLTYGELTVILEQFSPSVIFMIISGLLFWFAHQPVDIVQLKDGLEHPGSGKHGNYQTGDTTVAPLSSSTEDFKPVLAALGAAHRVARTAAADPDQTRAAFYKGEDETFVSAITQIAKLTYGSKIAEAWTKFIDRGELGNPCAGEMTSDNCTSLKAMLKVMGE